MLLVARYFYGVLWVNRLLRVCYSNMEVMFSVILVISKKYFVLFSNNQVMFCAFCSIMAFN